MVQSWKMCYKLLENHKRGFFSAKFMSPNRDWIIIITATVAIALAVAGAFMYPLNTMELHFILTYELLVVVCILSIMYLIYRKGTE